MRVKSSITLALVFVTLLSVVSTVGAKKPLPPPPTEYDFVNIGDPDSEAGHNLYGWGPVEPETHGGHWGGVLDGGEPLPGEDGNCRVISSGYSGEEGTYGATNNLEDGASFTMDFGPRYPGETKYLLLRALEGHARDSFYVYIDRMKGRPVYYWPGDDSASESWITHAIPLGLKGTHTIHLLSDQAHWSGWNTFGQVAFTWARVVNTVP